MKTIGKIIEYLLYLAIAAIAALVLASALPVPGGVKIFVVQSGSMEPAIKTGSVVIDMPQAAYKIGDVITFGPYSKAKPPVTHRVADFRLQSGQPIYITKGDANNAADAREVLPRDVIGKVRLAVPYAGYAVAAAKKPLGFALLIIVPAAIIIFSELNKIWTEVKRMRAKKKESPQPAKEPPQPAGENPGY
ncbi:MAG: signal peptidase I [Patescibacteria group bacterium]|nr:signal peptidase I [Patescibacteria group bacterium]